MRIWHGFDEIDSFISMCFGTKQRVRKWQKLLFTFISCGNHNFSINPIIIVIGFQYTLTTENCLGSVPNAGPPCQPV